MQLRDIQYVIAAAEAGSFSKAALVVHAMFLPGNT